MEYRYSISEKDNTVFVILEGQTRGKDFLSGIVEITGSPAYKSGMNFLIDLTGLKDYYSDFKTFQKFIGKIKTYSSLFGSRISCIVNAGVLLGYTDMMSVELKDNDINLAGFQLACKASEFLEIDCSKDGICSELRKLRFSCTKGECSINCRKRTH